jgi:hypothetical protein
MNISVRIPDEFMRTLLETPDKPFKARFGGVEMDPRYIDYDDHYVLNDVSPASVTY